MGKKFGINTKKQDGQERKAAIKKDAQEKVKKEKEDAVWKDEVSEVVFAKIVEEKRQKSEAIAEKLSLKEQLEQEEHEMATCKKAIKGKGAHKKKNKAASNRMKLLASLQAETGGEEPKPSDPDYIEPN